MSKILATKEEARRQKKVRRDFVNRQEILKQNSMKAFIDMILILCFSKLIDFNIFPYFCVRYYERIDFVYLEIINLQFRITSIIIININLFIFMVNFRSYQEFDCKNTNFIAISLALLVSFYLYAYESVILEEQYFISPWLIITSIFFALAIWSFVMVTIISPGEVPIYWALYNKETQQRKYCLICHNFKPQRSHHCSKCKKCVLNMDHHCPWINNCVGFYNKKYFVLFLLYIFISILLGSIQISIIEYYEIMQLYQGKRQFNIHTLLRMIGLAFLLILIIPVFLFLTMHIRMVLQNQTTLEVMVKQKKKNHTETVKFDQNIQFNKYDIGTWYNCTQVFGQNIFYWPLPIEDEKPLKGKGWYWIKNIEKQQFKHLGMFDFRI